MNTHVIDRDAFLQNLRISKLLTTQQFRLVIDKLSQRNPASLEVVTLLDRPSRRLANLPVKYTGFQIPNDYVVGYGLDFRELYRNLPFICVLKPGVYQDLAPRPVGVEEEAVK